MGARVVHWEILGKDAAKLQDFYATAFDWEIKNMEEMNYGIVSAQGDGGIGGGVGAAQEGAPGHVTFYIEVDDPQAHLNKIESLGGKTVMPVTEIPNMATFALFADPEGHVVGLVKSEG